MKDDNTMNRIWNSRNPAQGRFRRTLTVCSAGLLRSPTTAWVLSQEPYNRNVRPCGTEETYALIVLDDVLLNWADEIVFVSPVNYHRFNARFPQGTSKERYVLDIPDMYEFRDPKLVEAIKQNLEDVGFPHSNEYGGVIHIVNEPDRSQGG